MRFSKHSFCTCFFFIFFTSYFFPPTGYIKTDIFHMDLVMFVGLYEDIREVFKIHTGGEGHFFIFTNYN